MDFQIEDQLMSSVEALKIAGEQRLKDNIKIPLGVRYLDLALNGGIFGNDMVILSGASGIGKTEAALCFTENVARTGKKALYYGLEMASGEGAMRLEYRSLARLCKQHNEVKWISYQMFEGGELRQLEKRYRTLMDDDLNKFMGSITWRHKGTNFYVDDLKKELLENKDKTDIVFVDHLSFIDTFGKYNELKETEQVVKDIKNFCDIYSIPVVLVAHIRKGDRKAKVFIPHEEDIVGTKHIVNIASRIIMIAPDMKNTGHNGLYPTYIRVAKNRKAQYTTRYAARLNFNAFTNQYEDDFELVHVVGNCDDFIPIAKEDYPYWVEPYAAEKRGV